MPSGAPKRYSLSKLLASISPSLAARFSAWRQRNMILNRPCRPQEPVPAMVKSAFEAERYNAMCDEAARSEKKVPVGEGENAKKPPRRTAFKPVTSRIYRTATNHSMMVDNKELQLSAIQRRRYTKNLLLSTANFASKLHTVARSVQRAAETIEL